MFFFLIDLFYPNSLRYTAIEEYYGIGIFLWFEEIKRSLLQYFFSKDLGRWDGAGEPRKIREDVVHVRPGPGTEQTDGSRTSVQPGQVLPLELLPGVPGLSGDLWCEGRGQRLDLPSKGS